MASIYDDVCYVESMNNNIMNEEEERNIQITIQDNNSSSDKISCNDNDTDDADEFEYIINQVSQKHMFEKLLKETLDELNKTNPALEPGKYHMLCIYTRRYDRFIKKIDKMIIIYELKRLKKLKQQNPYSEWYWNCKMMTFYIIKQIQDFKHYYNHEKQNTEIEKNANDKKKD